MRVLKHRQAGMVVAVLGLMVLACAARAGVVTGKVTAQGEVPLSEMVVYLEATDAKQQVPVPAEHAKISQKGARFDPPMLVISVGQAVDFVNDEDRPIDHNVFSNTPLKRFDLGLYPPGESKSVTFEKSGAVFLYCSIHRQMDGVIFIAPTPLTSRVTPDGVYKIEGVPAGNWTVKTWQRRKRFPELSLPVAVEESKPATVNLELRRK
jgi:plastocyanin